MSQGFNVIRASQIPGVVLDCIVNPNSANVGKTASGGAPTDNTAAINGLLATASATNPIHLILDGGTATTGIILPTLGHVWLDGIGHDSGIFVLAGSNADPINNGKVLPFDHGTQPSPSGFNVKISNFCVNGNRGNGTTGNSNSGDPRGVTGSWWYCNINVVNITDISIEDMLLYDAPAYGIRLNGCSNVVIDNCDVYNPNVTATSNNDGIHIDGPSSNGRIANCRLNNNNSDDGIALNAPEGYGGAISNWVVSGNVFTSTATGTRIYGSNTAAVFNVNFVNNAGTVAEAVMLIGVGSTNPDIGGRQIVCANNNFTVTDTGAGAVAFILLNGPVGDLAISNCIWNGPQGTQGFITNWLSGTCTVGNLSVANCSIYRNTSGNSSAACLLLSLAATLTIKRLAIDNFQVADEQGQSYSAVPNLILMTNVVITNLFVAALDMTNITALADSYTNIGALAGPGYPNKQVIAANKTGAYTVIQTDAYLRGDATTATFAFTLPAAPYLYEEHEFVKVDSSANAVTIAGNGKTINGNASLGSQWAHAKMRYNGASWDSL